MANRSQALSDILQALDNIRHPFIYPILKREAPSIKLENPLLVSGNVKRVLGTLY
jgi:hypothetical protein